jgi:hypothetical protein
LDGIEMTERDVVAATPTQAELGWGHPVLWRD